MTTIDRRHRGRSIRRNRRRHPGASLVFVDIVPSLHGFERAVAELARIFERFGVDIKHRPQILHNGRKPR